MRCLKVKIEVWLDFTCPYCYIAIKRLYVALAEFPQNQYVRIEYMSYPLTKERHLSVSGKVSMARANVTQTTARVNEQVLQDLEQAAETIGVTFRFNPERQADTFQAHRLMKLAQSYNKQ